MERKLSLMLTFIMYLMAIVGSNAVESACNSTINFKSSAVDPWLDV